MFNEDKNMSNLFDEIEASNLSIPNKKRIENSAKSKNKIQFEESPDDSDLMSLLKNAINGADIKYQSLYDEYGRTKATNMINGMKKGQLSWDRFKEWLKIAGLQPTIIINKIEDNKE